MNNTHTQKNARFLMHLMQRSSKIVIMVVLIGIASAEAANSKNEALFNGAIEEITLRINDMKEAYRHSTNSPLIDKENLDELISLEEWIKNTRTNNSKYHKKFDETQKKIAEFKSYYDLIYNKKNEQERKRSK